jgi:hypothetical protein
MFASDANFICDHPSSFRAALTCSPVIIRAIRFITVSDGLFERCAGRPRSVPQARPFLELDDFLQDLRHLFSGVGSHCFGANIARLGRAESLRRG